MWQETSQGYQDLRRPGRKYLLPLLLMANFNFLRRSPVDTTLAIFEQTQKSVIAVTQFFRSCGNNVRTSEDQLSLRQEGRTQGSESPRMAKEEGRRFPPVGTDQVDPNMPPIDLGMILAGARRS